MGEISIKVSIANRIYPLKISFEEEESVRKAAKTINDRIKDYEENFAVRDKQDLLAMCALQLATEVTKSESKVVIDDNSFTDKLSEIDVLLTEFLAKN